ncbi:MAG: CBS domain-containing protein [Nanoarchaeota archaeon]|nr:CBS domain-containing protein [Nanoarchaeota archaeon]
MRNILVSDVMTRNVNTIERDANLLECAKKMVRKRTGSLVIVDKKSIAGFISNKDILWALIKKSQSALSEIKAKDISPKKIYTIKPSDSLEDAIKKMKKLKLFRLPVVDGKELVGLVTMKDILNFHPELYEDLREVSHIREEEEKLKRLSLAEKRVVVDYGVCEECGEKDTLYRENGNLVCASCLE